MEQERQSATIRSYISAIRAVLQDDGYIMDNNLVLIKAITWACRLKNDRVTTRLPIRKRLLTLILNQIPEVTGNQPYLDCLYRTIFSTAYFRLFRVGELMQSDHAVTCGNISIGKNKLKLMFVLRTSKTHGKDKKPQIIKISNTELQHKTNVHINEYCPYQLLRNYLHMWKSKRNRNEQFFVFSDCSPVKLNHARAVLKKTISSLGLDESLYGFHGFRAGRVTDLSDLGLSLESLKAIRRWKLSVIFTCLKV